MRPPRARHLAAGTVLFAALVLAACDGDSTGPSFFCNYDGITNTDATGLVIGSEDPSDWCANVSAAAPNPASAGTAIRLTLAEDSPVRIVVQGFGVGEVRTLVDEVLPAGVHSIWWDMTTDAGARVQPGIYCVTIRTEEYECSGDILVV